MEKQFGIILTTSHEAGYSNEDHSFWTIEEFDIQNMQGLSGLSVLINDNMSISSKSVMSLDSAIGNLDSSMFIQEIAETSYAP